MNNRSYHSSCYVDTCTVLPFHPSYTHDGPYCSSLVTCWHIKYIAFGTQHASQWKAPTHEWGLGRGYRLRQSVKFEIWTTNWILTHNGRLQPVPIGMVVNDGVLAMPIVHLTSLASQLVQFDPCLLCCFTMEVTHRLNICWGKKISVTTSNNYDSYHQSFRLF